MIYLILQANVFTSRCFGNAATTLSTVVNSTTTASGAHSLGYLRVNGLLTGMCTWSGVVYISTNYFIVDISCMYTNSLRPECFDFLKDALIRQYE